MKKVLTLIIVIVLASVIFSSKENKESVRSEQSGSQSADVTVHAESDDNGVTDTASEPEFEPGEENNRIAENFCYVIYATGNCNDLIMRMDTREKVEKIVGAEINSPQSPYSDACLEGLMKAQEDKSLCNNAWKQFGCSGSVMPNLIQQSPFGNDNPILCKFK